MFEKTYGEGSEALTLRIGPYTPNQSQLKRRSAREHVAAGHWVGSLSGVAVPAARLDAVIAMSVILLSKYGIRETAKSLSREIGEMTNA